MVSSFQHRRLRITFKLATGSFNKEGDPDTVALEGYRAEADINAPGGYEFSTCNLRIFGLEQEVMNRLSVINYQNLDFMRNSLTVEATDNNGEFSVIFIGEIYIAQPDYMGAPDVPFVAEARAGLISSLSTSAATSFPGAVPVKVMMAQLAAEVGLTFENNGVESTLTDQYLSGTPIQKIQKIAEAARIQYWYIPEQGVLAIAPMGVARVGDPVKFNMLNGLVGWPTRLHVGIAYTSLFNPAIFHGCRILMESDVPSCNGEWYIIRMNHKLSSEIPGGPWFSYFTATPENQFIFTR